MRRSRIINLPNLLASAKMESIGDNSMSDSRIYFDTTLRDGPSSLPASGISCTISFDAIRGLLYFSIQFAERTF
jgi:hypothetical protein